MKNLKIKLRNIISNIFFTNYNDINSTLVDYIIKGESRISEYQPIYLGHSRLTEGKFIDVILNHAGNNKLSNFIIYQIDSVSQKIGISKIDLALIYMDKINVELKYQTQILKSSYPAKISKLNRVHYLLDIYLNKNTFTTSEGDNTDNTVLLESNEFSESKIAHYKELKEFIQEVKYLAYKANFFKRGDGNRVLTDLANTFNFPELLRKEKDLFNDNGGYTVYNYIQKYDFDKSRIYSIYTEKILGKPSENKSNKK